MNKTIKIILVIILWFGLNITYINYASVKVTAILVYGCFSALSVLFLQYIFEHTKKKQGELEDDFDDVISWLTQLKEKTQGGNK